MDGNQNQIGTTSFIPKKPLITRGGFGLSRQAGANASRIFLFLSVVIFFVSLGAYFVALRQESTKTKDVANLKTILERAQAQFEPDQILNMTRFDMKINAAKDLIYFNKSLGVIDTTEHITLRPLFKLLADKTLKSVRFKDFRYSNIDNQKIEIKMSGEAKGVFGNANYAAVAQQAREFSDTRVLTNVIISDLNLGPNNNVTFSLTASIKPELVSYAESFKQ